jgi:hypothetical protein
MKNITYFLGAGASYHAIPLVKPVTNEKGEIIKPSITEDMIGTFKEIGKEFRSKYKLGELYTQEGSEYERFESVCNSIISTLERAKNFQTLDTYAKKVYLTNSEQTEEGINIRRALVFYFTYKQLVWNEKNRIEYSIDERYISLFAGLLERTPLTNIKLGDNFKFVTWNYDFQVELALLSFDNSLPNFGEFLSKNGVYPNNQRSANSPYRFIHLNGMSGFRYDYENPNDYLYFNGDIFESKQNWLYRVFFDLDGKTNDYPIYFAWEKESNISFHVGDAAPMNSNGAVKEALKVIEKTNILVVIGYSFPFFNREVDRQLFNSEVLKNCEKIYVQDPNFDKDSFIEQFQLSSFKDRIFKVAHTKEGLQSFFIPPEL